ncbi:Rha family transcriptional regulator [Photorhabdus temperata]|uniref:Phage regulatory protein, rha family n=2 Tax=Photorhabdus temperata TaxID=574560 RepID=A0A081RSS5_PHOTE|nr:Rha family transcriptional regulator [Photorhabdus temperata]ERT11894.1 hypothetical protein O185_17055 [Photorhabdus temperata J3]KER01728.1 phage regulatory protein, rha family [Photorhabdus temperata subsp. temperata Meg1]MCT8348780.1 Rha family transcriptional regulator [Photorhabdus temperata]
MKKITALVGNGQIYSKFSRSDILNNELFCKDANKSALAMPEVIIVGNKPVTTSQAIGKYFKRDHDKIIKRIENLDCSDEFLTRNFRRVQYWHRGNEYDSYEVTKDGFSFLVMGFTGKKAAAFKENYIKQFNYMENWITERLETKAEYRSLADAVKLYIERNGDDQRGHTYSNEFYFLNTLVLGESPKRWAKTRDIHTRQIRDNMSTEQLELLTYLEMRSAALFDLDIPKDERKQKLTKLTQRWLAKRMEAK